MRSDKKKRLSLLDTKSFQEFTARISQMTPSINVKNLADAIKQQDKTNKSLSLIDDDFTSHNMESSPNNISLELEEKKKGNNNFQIHQSKLSATMAYNMNTLGRNDVQINNNDATLVVDENIAPTQDEFNKKRVNDLIEQDLEAAKVIQLSKINRQFNGVDINGKISTFEKKTVEGCNDIVLDAGDNDADYPEIIDDLQRKIDKGSSLNRGNTDLFGEAHSNNRSMQENQQRNEEENPPKKPWYCCC